MSARAIAAAKEELETAEASILSWFAELAEKGGDARNIVPVFMAVARSVHRAAAMLEVVDPNIRGPAYKPVTAGD